MEQHLAVIWPGSTAVDRASAQIRKAAGLVPASCRRSTWSRPHVCPRRSTPEARWGSRAPSTPRFEGALLDLQHRHFTLLFYTSLAVFSVLLDKVGLAAVAKNPKHPAEFPARAAEEKHRLQTNRICELCCVISVYD